MSIEDAYNLNEVQLSYEYDSQNPKKLYDYMLELNKHQFYLTAVKEYDMFIEKMKADYKNKYNTAF